MMLHELLSICDAYTSLGTSVQEQLNDVCELGNFEEQNPNAMAVAADFLRQVTAVEDKELRDEAIALLSDLLEVKK